MATQSRLRDVASSDRSGYKRRSQAAHLQLLHDGVHAAVRCAEVVILLHGRGFPLLQFLLLLRGRGAGLSGIREGLRRL